MYLLNVCAGFFALKWEIFRKMAGYGQGVFDALKLHPINLDDYIKDIDMICKNGSC